MKEILEKKAKLSFIDHTEEIKKAEREAITMVVLNSLANFLFRLPESFIFLMVFFDPSKFKRFCYGFQECASFADVANVFYLFFLSLNFFFYKSFNILRSMEQVGFGGLSNFIHLTLI